MAANRELADTLRQFTQALVGERTDRDGQYHELIDALNQQRDQNAALLNELRTCNNAPAPVAPFAAPAAVAHVPQLILEVVESIPRFLGASTDYAQGFVDHVNRVGDIEG